MNFLIEILPILTFFIIYKKYNLHYAIILTIIVSFLQIFIYKFFYKKFNFIQIVTFMLMLIFGSITILLENEIYIKMKPTVLYTLMSVAFYISHFIGNKNPIIKIMIGNKIKLPNKIWYRLSYSWIFFFLFLSILNLYIAYSFSTDTWINFKIFGTLILNAILLILQFILVYKYIKFN